MKDLRPRIAVIFGGISVEHEISIITGLEFISALDPRKYVAIPVYISPKGRWYTGAELLDKNFYRNLKNLDRLLEVTLLPTPNNKSLKILKKPSSQFVKGFVDLFDKRQLNFAPLKELFDQVMLRQEIEIDCVATLFHGQNGEDGKIQGLLELAQIPYTSADLLPIAMSMNKYVCKEFLRNENIPSLPAELIEKSLFQFSTEAVVEQISKNKYLSEYPLFIKPNNLGSSVGVSKVDSSDQLIGALAKVFKYDQQALVEPCVTSLQEINVSVIEGDQPMTARSSPVEIPISLSGVLTYEEKYLRGGKGAKSSKRASSAQGMASLSRIVDPKDLPQAIKNKVKGYAEKSYLALRCSGVVRFDFIHDLATGKIYFNELNPLPGSFSHYLWIKAEPRLLYTDLIDHLLKKAFQRHAEKYSLALDIGFKALFA